ncbi:GNAT family N-acetyltransferase [Leekyejoonella antrihumi]|uniref:GNAT family N-acetyltransferase n=1 Tax=Leekyejoonella antrihumi TaxID=1660198 RepID=A0A563E4R1_9MICO|nr:GNAT family N-acetyltransferase [Leekyejoonella antrihumi]TWP37191.1 GNAT family N-acetyltransferase [Leekyejoonella antrihumi]
MTSDLGDQQLLEEFHRQIRLGGREDEPAPGIVQDTDELVVRRYPERPGTSYCMVECPRGLGVDPGRAIARQVDFFTARRERVEWKTYSYDEPGDLTGLLMSAGFVAESPETLLLGEVGGLIQDVDLPPGVRVRAVTSDADLSRIDELMKTIWGPDRGDGSLAREMRANPDALDVVVVEESAAGPVLSAGWLRYSAGTDFASMWGGSTLPEWRRKGLYRATVTHRARLAREQGYRFMRLDTSPDSRPILVRLGLRAVATTTPYTLDARGEAV